MTPLRADHHPLTPVAQLLLRLLGAIYAIAFASLLPQMLGLFGSDGILPIESYLERVAASPGIDVTWFPTLFWISSSDVALVAGCAIGLIFGLLMALGASSLPFVAAPFVLYLSIVSVGQAFLSFQWDTLLLESGLFALLLARVELRPFEKRRSPRNPVLGVWSLRMVLVKLMVLSGLVKLLSFDDAWLELTALEAHFFTQPIPNPVSWLAHQLPDGLLALATFVTLAVEIAVPIGLFFSRSRLVSVLILLALQVGILATGNYGFFNLLTMVLTLSWLDASSIRRIRGWLGRQTPSPSGVDVSAWGPRHVLLGLLTLLHLGIGLREIERTLPRDRMPALAALAARGSALAQPAFAVSNRCRCVNGYGLFRAMTLERPEIQVEWSADGNVWNELEFRYKPGDPAKRPSFLIGHMPRLDWQMWFAALAPQRETWLEPFLRALLEGRPSVWGLLEERPERLTYVRLVAYDYELTSRRSDSSDWWQRVRLGEITEDLDLRRLGGG